MQMRSWAYFPKEAATVHRVVRELVITVIETHRITKSQVLFQILNYLSRAMNIQPIIQLVRHGISVVWYFIDDFF